MLDSFIIEELRRRQEERKRESERPRLELPRYPDRDPKEPRGDDSDHDRGVVIIDI